MDGTGIPNLADKLQHLFRTIPQGAGAGWYTNEAMVRALAARGVVVTVQHLSSLRNGRRDNPSAKMLAAIADVFGVPLDYFFDEEAEKRVNDELDTLAQLRRAGGLRLRGGLDAEGLASLLAAIQRVHDLDNDQ